MSAGWQPNWSMPSGSKDGWADDYERGRPGWPREAVEVAKLPSTARVLDLAAGTGKLTRVLTSVFDDVTAVEPAGAMRERLRTLCPDVEALAGNAEAIPLAGGSVDAVFAAQAFTHFDAPRAVPEIARVLRPGGVLVLLWNLPGGEWEPSTTAAEGVLAERMPSVSYVPLDLGGPSALSGWQPEVSDTPFEKFQATVIPNSQRLDRDGLVAFYATMGWLADLPDDERLPLLAQIRAELGADGYTREWEAHVHWSRLAAT